MDAVTEGVVYTSDDQFFWDAVFCLQPMRGIRMMCIAIEKAQQSPAQLTSIHTDLAQVRQYTATSFNTEK